MHINIMYMNADRLNYPSDVLVYSWPSGGDLRTRLQEADSLRLVSDGAEHFIKT
jgi:hypothetical protein